MQSAGASLPRLFFLVSVPATPTAAGESWRGSIDTPYAILHK